MLLALTQFSELTLNKNKMNFKHILSTVLTFGLFLISCRNPQTNTNQDKADQTASIDTSFLIGSWEDQSKSALNFTLYTDGTAQSDNMTTLLYQEWHLKGDKLFLVVKSIGNKQSFIDTIAYSIQKLNNSELTLKREDLILEYKKVNKNNETIQSEGNKTLSEQKSKTLKGELILGHEARTFKPCGSDKTFWISDKTGKLKQLYTELTKSEKPYSPIFAEIEVIDKGRAKEGFPADYESTYEIIKVLKTRDLSDKDCK